MKLNGKKKSWRILIGPWLLKFISVINNRIYLVNDLKKKEKNFYFNPDINKNSLISHNMSDYSDKILTKEYNNIIFDRIINGFENTKIFQNKDQNKFEIENVRYYFHIFISKIVKLIGKIFFLKNNFVFYKIYVGNFFTTLKLLLHLKEIPQNYSKFSDTQKNSRFKFNYDLRKKIKFNIKNKQDKLFYNLLIESMPTIYIEGFKNKISEVNKSFLPKKIKNVFTCNVFSDSLFKFWLSLKINSGLKLFYGQHGGGYHFLKDEPHEKHEIEISDYYISWGWKNGRKVLPGCLFSVLSRKKFKFIESGKISIIFDVLHFYSDTNDCRHSIELDGADKKFFLNSNEFIYKFLNSVSDKNLKNTYLKFHPFEKRSEFSFEYFLTKNFKNLNILKNKKNIFDIFKESKLVVFTYFHATGFNQCVALNKPCIAFTVNADKIILDKYKKLWNKMHKVGIFHSNYRSAANFLDKNSEKLKSWWFSEETQTVLNEFKKEHASKGPESFRLLTKILKNKMSN